MLDNVLKNLSNIIGWSTNRHIIVFESDDWGSIRTRSLKDRCEMEAKGLNFHTSIFPRYDCLESNDDLERLFELLSRHKDQTGRSPVITPMCIMVNPDFEKISNSQFREYHYETFPETCKRYPNHDRILSLWKEGIEKRLFVPALHGREHYNVIRWMKNLQDGRVAARILFDHQSSGVTTLHNEILPEYLGAFHPDKASEIPFLKETIKDACKIFEDLLGYKPTHFIGPNREPAKAFDETFAKMGVKYMTVAKRRHYPLGDGKYKNEFIWPGKRDKETGITYISRNGGFEQVDPGHDWVNECLYDIEVAFRFKKPCVISTHRVNYVGGIEEKNATEGIRKLDELLKEILKRWPDTEFMTSTELGELIVSKDMII